MATPNSANRMIRSSGNSFLVLSAAAHAGQRKTFRGDRSSEGSHSRKVKKGNEKKGFRHSIYIADYRAALPVAAVLGAQGGQLHVGQLLQVARRSTCGHLEINLRRASLTGGLQAPDGNVRRSCCGVGLACARSCFSWATLASGPEVSATRPGTRNWSLAARRRAASASRASSMPSRS